MSDSKVYIAEKILSERKHRGVKQYLIKWKGYPMSANTWEPVENILCPSLLTTFENRKNASGRKKLKTTQTAATNGHSSRKSLQRSISQSPRQQTPASTPTPEPQPQLKHTTARASSSPLARASSSPRPAPSPASRTPETHASPRPHSNQSAHATSSSPGLQSLNHDSPKSPKLPLRSQTPITKSPKQQQQQHQQHIDSRSSESPPRLEISLQADETPKGSPSQVKPQAFVMQRSPIAARQVSTQSPALHANNSARSSQAQISTSVQVYKPQVAMSSFHANAQIQVAQPKNRKFAVMSTVITDVTVNNHTITISESKTNQGFFREGNRNSVDATTQF